MTRKKGPAELTAGKRNKKNVEHSPSPVPEDRIPVIVGVGEIVDRPKEIAAGLEPLTLLEQALKRAEETPAANCSAKSNRSTSSIS